MSELKAIDMIVNDDYKTKVYFKSEADKVISDKDDKITQYKVLYKEKCRDINNQERHFAKQIHHQKYKRCLAMADLCEARYDEEDAKVNGCGASWEYISKEMKYWERWHERWLELADEFKHNNEVK